MALQKQNIPINFAKGLDQKSDPKQIPVGRFAELENSVFDKEGLLKKRNGFGSLQNLPVSTCSYLSTYNGSLTALGSSVYSYSQGSLSWVNRGSIKPVKLSTLPLVRNNRNQTQCDSAISNGLICTVYIEDAGSNSYRYVVSDQLTGQTVVSPTVITPPSGSVNGAPRVFVLGRNFLIVYTNLITATNHLRYLAINTQTPSTTSTADITSLYTPAAHLAFDGYVANDTLFLAWNGSDGGGAVRMAKISSTLVVSSAKIFATQVATIVSVCADTTLNSPIIYAAYYNSGTSILKILAVDQSLNTVLAPTTVGTSLTVPNITSSAQSGVATVFYENTNAYSYDSGVATNYISKRTCTQAGSLGTATVVSRSVGLASKSFIVDETIYLLAAYSSTNQPSYFLMNASGEIVSKLAYSNGGGYLPFGLPAASVDDSVASIPYLIKDMIAPVNKTQGVSAPNGVYAQTGVNLATFTIGDSAIVSAEIGGSLNLSGGFMWGYDGYSVVENGFFVWPDSVELSGSATGGTMTAQQYYYVAVYEWCDNNGNIQRSAPSIPVSVTTTGATSSVTVNVPTLRLTYKVDNAVKITIYRWSTAQQTYYQVTSVASPTMNSKVSDSIAFLDTLPDSSIVGNSILYTTGGTVENISAPACKDLSLFKSRAFAIDAEDQNLLWYSKQVIEQTPVEMSDLFTIYVAPTIGAQGSTSVMECTAPLDDKLIIYKKDAIYYIVGTGPDNTGANNDFSEPVFITSTVGSQNKASIVTIPQGQMFESDKGIWLLGRDLQTSYIGAPVEDYTRAATVLSAVTVPGTNQVRFNLSSGITLMYDYFFSQWGIFKGISAISSTIYQGYQTVIDGDGKAYQETPDTYLDGASPVLMRFKTGPLNLAGLQGFQRAYYFFFIGDYISPHTLTASVYFDYSSTPQQIATVTPDNFNATYGVDPIYGSYPYGGTARLEQWQIFFNQQKCQSIQVAMQESYDPSLGSTPGAGLTLSGLTFSIGLKDGSPRLKASNSTG